MDTSSTGLLQDSSRFISHTFRRALLPAIFAIGGVMASTLANNLIAGNLLGDQALAVLSLANPIYFIFATIGSLAGAGAASLAAWCTGRDDQAGRNAAVTLAALLSLGVSLLLALLGRLFLPYLVSALGAGGTLLSPTLDYISVYLFSGVGIAGIYPPYFLLKLEGRNRLSMALFLGLAAGCIGLELFCVLVLGLGLEGIAWGCTIANVGTALVGWAFLLGTGSTFRLCSPAGLRGYVLPMLTAGSPAALNNLCSVLRGVALNLSISALADRAGLSALSVMSMASNLSLILINGLAQTTGPFVGVFTGERDNVSLRQLERQALQLGLILILPAAALLAALAEPFCRLFGVTSPETLALSVSAVRLFAISLPFSMLSTLLMNYYLSAGRTWLANLLTVCRGYLLLAASLPLLTALFDTNGVWLSFTAAEVLSWLLLLPVLLLFRCRHPELGGILLLDRQYEADSRFISFSVATTQEDIMSASVCISAFCEENELPPDKAMLISLSLEEMLMSIKEHSFQHTQEESINIRILIAPGEVATAPIILRIRCSGAPFNPIDYYERHRLEAASGQAEEGDPDSLLDGLLEGLDDSLGIAMILAAAPSVDYQTTFGVNNLTITL